MVFALDIFWWGFCCGIAASVFFCRVIRKHFADKRKARMKK